MHSDHHLRNWLVLSAIVVAVSASTSLRAQQEGVTAAQLTKPPTDSWPTYHGDHSGRHYSPLTQINTANVNQLTLLWSSRPSAPANEPNSGGVHKDGDPYYWAAASDPASGSLGNGEPLVVDGRIYVSGRGHAWALDAYTGEQLWHYYWKGTGDRALNNRGMAMLGNRLYFQTPDCYLVSLDAKTGKERWHQEIADVREFRYCSTAPVIIKNHVIAGMSGDTSDVQGWLSSFDPETGALQWKWYTTPQTPNDPGYDTWPDDYSRTHGAAMPWQMATYDADLNLLYITTGNPNPVFAPQSRNGDNAYSNSVAALNADTGKLAWYFQFIKHETHDWDTVMVPVLIDGVFQGQQRKMLACACANGYFFLLDRSTGKSLLTTLFTQANNTFLGIDERGQLIPDPKKDPVTAGTLVAPGKATFYTPPTFHPPTGLMVFGMGEGYNMIYISDDSPRPEGWGGIGTGQGPIGRVNALKAIDYKTGKVVWTRPDAAGGLLSTAGNVVFGGESGRLMAWDVRNGKVLWRTAAAGSPATGPVTFMLDGRQMLLVNSGSTLYMFSL